MNDLGPALSTHKGRFAAGGYLWYLGTLMLVFGAWAVVSAPFTGDWARAGNGVLAVVVVPLVVAWPAYKLRQTLTIHQNGFVWERPFRAPLVVRWAEVRGVHVSQVYERRTLHTKGMHLEIQITLEGGREVVVTNDLDKIEDLQGYLRNAASQAGVASVGAPGTMPGAAPGAGAPPSPWG